MFGLKREDSVILPINGDETTIGRHTNNDVVINDLPVSRFHSCILKIGGRYFIKDKKTVNGTYIRKYRLMPDRETSLRVGDVIGIGCKANENPKCTLEVVLIQLKERDETIHSHPENLEETRNTIVDSTTDKQVDESSTLCHPFKKESSSDEIVKGMSSRVLVSDNSTSQALLTTGETVCPPENASTSSTRLVRTKIEAQTDGETECGTASVPVGGTASVSTGGTTSVPAGGTASVPTGGTTNLPSKLKLESSPVKNRKKNNSSLLFDVDDPSKDGVLCIDLLESSDDETDVKPLFTNGVEYSTSDEVIVLDSDEEDFPCSQLDASRIGDVPDFSSMFESMFDEDQIDNSDTSVNLRCSEDTWFESLSVSTLIPAKKLIVDLPMLDFIPRTLKSDVEVSEANKSGAEPSSSGFATDTVIDLDEEGTLSEKENNCVRSPKRRLSEDDIDTASKPLRKKVSFGQVSKERTSDESTKALVCTASKKMSTQPCWVVLPSLVQIHEKKRKRVKSAESVSKKKAVEDCCTTESNQEVKLDETRTEDKGEEIEKKKKKKKKLRSKKNVDTDSDHSDQKNQLKEIRKERLKQIATKVKSPLSDTKSENANGPVEVVAKVTKKNRSAHLIDSICNNEEQTHPKSMSDVKSFHTYRGSELVSEVMNNDGRKEEFNDSFLDDALDLASQSPNTSVSVACDVEEQLSNEPRETFKRPHKRIAHKKSKSSKEKKRNSDSSFAGKQNEFPTKKKSKARDNPTINTFDMFELVQGTHVDANPVPEIADCTIRDEFNRDIKLKKGFYRERNEKRVQFYEGVPEYNLFVSDPEERRNNGIFAPRYKLNESLIREELYEFETAIAIACRWSVKWLEEQKKIIKPPPNLYKPLSIFPDDIALVGCYKEKLKEEIFLNLWGAVYSSYNKPEKDFLPHTQYLLDGNKSGLYTLSIESVDASRTASLWTIYAYREIDEFSVKDELINGQMVVLNFYVKRNKNEAPHKTMVFAYVASVHQIVVSGGVDRQRIVFKIFQKDFEIMAGKIKIKVLTYTKTYLRPFQALAMITRSPLTKILINQDSGSMMLPVTNDGENFIDVFLDPTQMEAINRCLTSISLCEPSICLIDGPAGCGKSQVIVSLLNELFSKEKRRWFPDDLKVLVITNSENTADDLAYRLEKRDINLSTLTLLRYGNGKNIHHKVKYCTLDERVRTLIENDENESLINLEEEKRNLVAKKNSVQLVLESPSARDEKKAEARVKLAALEREFEDLTSCDSRIKCQLQAQAAKDEAIEKADVIVTSVSSCWSSNFENDFVPSQFNKGDIHKFTVCIFDDANYVDEVQMLVPTMLMVRSLILVGDSKNTFRFKDESRSPFLRLVRDFEMKKSNMLTKLDQQHRMHPGISQWFSEYYCLNFKAKQILNKTSLTPMLVVYLKESGEKKSATLNRMEKQINFCCHLLQKILEIEKNDIPVDVIVSSEADKEQLKMQIHISINRANRIRVCTTADIFGRENEIVLLCLPVKRCDLDSWLYVASSRARSNLIILGYFTNVQYNRSIQWLLASAGLKNFCKQWNVDDRNFPDDYLRSH